VLVLGIETSNPSALEHDSRHKPGIALLHVEVGQCSVEPIATDNPHVDDLMGAVSRLCQREGVTPNRIQRVGVSIGPGGYTATRLAVVATKMICEATGAACCAIESSRVVALSLHAMGLVGPCAVALASKGDTAHVTCFDAAGAMLGQGRLMGAEALDSDFPPTLVIDRFAPTSFLARAGEMAIRIVRPEFDPAACARLAIQSPAFDPVALAPLYPREPEAVTKWRAKGPKGL
jgi:tRNA A37 threonylcarbamoyladenosine modification protein TsaB